MEEEFLDLEQKHRTVDEYVAEFLRLSRFADYMVATEENRASRFQQGLRFDIHRHLASHQMKTYSEVLAAACRVDRIVEKHNKAEVQQRLEKRLYKHMIRESPPRSHPTSPEERLYLFCGFCRKPGHLRKNC